MEKYAYVLTAELLSQHVGAAALKRAVQMAKTTPANEEALAALVDEWTVTVGGVKFHAGHHLLSIVKVSKDNRRTGKRPDGSTSELQVRRVSYPRPLSRLLKDLDRGRAIAVVLSGVGSVAVAAWCIVDTDPAKATEQYVRNRLALIENFPYYNRGQGPSERGAEAGRAALLFEESRRAPTVATIIQIFRTQSLSGWTTGSGSRPSDLNRHLAEKIWEVLHPYLVAQGSQLLIGEMLHAIDSETVAKVGKLQPGWSFYSSRGFRSTGVFESHDWVSPDEDTNRCTLTYEQMVAPVGNVCLNTPWGKPVSLSIRPGPAVVAFAPGTRRVPTPTS